jgi:KaiC/GvpD/RAD55 family RecA-like ATPase
VIDSLSISERWAALRAGDLISEPPLAPTAYQQPRLFKPFADAADDYVRWAQSPQERIYTGIQPIDAEMRGIAPGEMCELMGYSHSGKTLVLLEILKQNRDRNVLYFCPDEPRTLTLIKLACVLHGIDALDLERRVSADDVDAIGLLRSTALEHFPHLAVFDEPISLSDMDRAVGEVRDAWGRKEDFVVLDYLELLNGGGDDVPSKANNLKSWGRVQDVPFLVLHQTSRSSGADGRSLSISSGAYGGEQQATHIIGVRRKIFEIEAAIRSCRERLDTAKDRDRVMQRIVELEYEREIHKFTITLNLVKNKRPGGRLVSDQDFEIEKGSGRLKALRGDLPTQYKWEQEPLYND